MLNEILRLSSGSQKHSRPKRLRDALQCEPAMGRAPYAQATMRKFWCNVYDAKFVFRRSSIIVTNVTIK